MSVYTALVTPFKECGDVDYESFEKLVRFQIENGIDGLVIFGTTGESPTLEIEEKYNILMKLDMILVDYENFRDKIILGFGGNCTKSVLREIKNFSDFNYNNYMLSAPYYNKPTQEGIYHHFTQIMSNFSNKNFIIYNIPSRTGVNIETETIERICKKCCNYIGVKEASGSLEQAKEIINKNIPTFSGDDSLGYDMTNNGGVGVISVASNLYPKLVKEMLIEKPSDKVVEFYNLIFMETNPSPIKYLLKKNGLINSDMVRLPLVKTSENCNKIMDRFFKENPDFHEN